MILLALGSNLPHPQIGPPAAVLDAALDELIEAGIRVVQVSRYYASAPVPASDQPWFVNAVAEIACDLEPEQLLQLLHRVEAIFGRERGEANAARTLDLDLLAYNGEITAPDEHLQLPHPRMAERAFVVLPLRDLAPDWRHPVCGKTAREMAAALPEDQEIQPLV